MPGLLRNKVDSSLYKDESTFLRKPTKYVGHNNVKHRQMYRDAMTRSVKSSSRSILLDVTIIIKRRMQLSSIEDSECGKSRPLTVSASPQRWYFGQDTHFLV